MAEPACLRRSFSNPSETIHEFKEGDPTRALGESISFGRYMSESLAWEKWSTFSHNRYLEEAEKYSKPGSVAKMKAYFEAHYSRIGAKKRAVEEQANNDTSSNEVQSAIGNLPTLDTESTPPKSSASIYGFPGKEGSTAKKRAVEEQANNDSSSGETEVQSTIGNFPSLNTESTLANSCKSIYELPGKEDSNVELLSGVIISSCDSSAPSKELQSQEVNIVESGVNVDTIDSLSEVQEHQCEDAEVKACINENLAEIKVNRCKNAPESYINVESGVNVDTIDSLSTVQEHQCKDAEVVNECITENFAEINVNQCKDAPKSNIIVGNTEKELSVKMEAEKAKSSSRIKQKSVDSSLKGPIKGNVSKLSSSLVRLATPARPKRESSDTPNKRMIVKESIEKQKPTPKLVSKRESSDTPNKRMIVKESIEKQKPTPKLVPKRESSDTPNKRMFVKDSIEKKKPTPKLVHGSSNSDVNTMKKSSPVSRKSGIGKVFTPLGKIIRDRFASSPAPSRASVNSISRHPSATPQTETKRSRIALEKSFARTRTVDQKLQSPSAGKMNSSVPSSTTFSSFSFRTEERAAIRREVKPKIDSRKSSQCVNIKANATLDIKSDILSDKTKKIASTRTQLPKCVSKSASEVARGTCTRPPQRSIDSKLGAEKSKPIATFSRAFPPKKKTHENASPNIL